MIRLVLLTVALLLLASTAEAQGRGHINNCLVSATPVAFGTFSGSRSDSVSTIMLIFDGNGNGNPYTVALSQGLSNSFIDRTMFHSLHDVLHYNLYLDAARSLIWGNGQGETRLSVGTFNFPGGAPVSRDLPVYGRIPFQPAPPPGRYIDQIIVTVTF
jgi:spore coat protein U-like protein